ncbi:MAG: hypothetical protein NT062_00785 [Proteobacteria bacterium]|nr:hypothetical protein [Pseudomonadota bacterium]
MGVLASWEDQKSHDTFLRLVTLHGEFAWAAACYRHESRSRGQGETPDPIAERELERVTRAAELTLRSTASSRTEARSFGTLVTVLFVLIAVVGTSLVYIYIRQEVR